jgi:polyferredoxin
MFLEEKRHGEVIKIKPSIHTFLEFCKSKPPEEQYDYRNIHMCACGQFAHLVDAVGQWKNSVHPWLLLNRFADDDLQTFGAIVNRIEKYLSVMVGARLARSS